MLHTDFLGRAIAVQNRLNEAETGLQALTDENDAAAGREALRTLRATAVGLSALIVDVETRVAAAEKS